MKTLLNDFIKEDCFSNDEIEFIEDLFDYHKKLNYRKLSDINYFSVNTKHIELIIGREEFISLNFLTDKNDLKNYNVISIKEPSEKFFSDSFFNNFNNHLQLSFSDIRYDIDDLIIEKNIDDEKTLKTLNDIKEFVINDEQINELKNFILKNSDKKFIIHCTVGISRSSAVGLIVEDLLNYNSDDINNEHSKIINHQRYSPNRYVYFKAMNKEFIPSVELDLDNTIF